MNNFKEFLDYCESFYSPTHSDPLYPIDGLTREELALATLNYLDLCEEGTHVTWGGGCLLYTSPSPRDRQKSRMPSSA